MVLFKVSIKIKKFKSCGICSLNISSSSNVDSQKNLLICTKLAEDKDLVAASPTYEDLFSADIEKQINIAIILREKYGKRTTWPYVHT